MNKKTFRDFIRRGVFGGGTSLPKGAIGAWLVRNGLTDSIGLLITRDQVDESIADIFFDGATRRSDSEIIALAFASSQLNAGYMFGVEGVILVVYPPGTSDYTLYRALRYVKALQSVTIGAVGSGGVSDQLNYTHHGSLWVKDSAGVLRSPLSGPVLNSGLWDNTNGVFGKPISFTDRLFGSAVISSNGGSKLLTCGGAIENKITARKRNPTSTAGVNRNGDAAALVQLVDDSAALLAAGLDGCCSGNVYELNNAAGVSQSWFVFDGYTGSTGSFSARSYIRRVSGAGIITQGWNNSTLTAEFGQTTDTRYLPIYGEAKVPADATRRLRIGVPAGCVARVIMPELIESPCIFTPALPVNGTTDDAAAYTTPPTYSEFPATDLDAMVVDGVGNNFCMLLRVCPTAKGQSATILSSTQDADNNWSISATATGVTITSEVAADAVSASATYRHSTNLFFWLAIVFSEYGISVLVCEDAERRGSWSSVTSATALLGAKFGSTIRFGASDTDIFAASYPVGPVFASLTGGSLVEMQQQANALLSSLIFTTSIDYLRIGVVGDPHYTGYSGQGGLTDTARTQLLLEKFNYYRVDHAIFAGDTINENTAAWDTLIPMLNSGLDADYSVVHGNHDMTSEALYVSKFGHSKNWSFTVGNYAFVALDNYPEPGFTSAAVSNTWLAAELTSRASADGIIVLTHMFESGAAANKPVIASNSDVRLVLHGHLHTFTQLWCDTLYDIGVGHWSVPDGGLWSDADVWNFALLKINQKTADISVKQVYPAHEYPGYSQVDEVRQIFSIT